HRDLDRAPADRDSHEVAVLDAELARGGDADVGRVVPRQLAHRVRQLLQPGDVREPAVGDLGVDVEVDLELAGGEVGGLERRGEPGELPRGRVGARARDAV